MPIKKSAKKYMRSSARRKSGNLQVKKSMKALIKQVRDTVKAQDEKNAQEHLRAAIKSIDKAAQKAVIKKNTASRKKSRLVKAVKGLKKK